MSIASASAAYAPNAATLRRLRESGFPRGRDRAAPVAVAGNERTPVAFASVDDAQQLILAEKLANGRMTMKEILSVRFSQLEGA